ncbi:MAG: hypothetical protein WCP22_10245 [Chlamydiota bacterium]
MAVRPFPCYTIFMHRFTLLILAAFLSVPAASGLAETWGWSGTAPLPGADDAFRLLSADDGSLYAATGPKGAVFRTDDGGATWSLTAALPGARQIYALLQAQGGAVYAGTSPGGTLFRTVDGGASWSAAFSAPGVSEVKSLARTSDGSLYAGTGPEGRVFVTRDGGTSWDETGGLAGARFVYCLLAASDGSVYAGTDCGVFVTRDGGARWDGTGGPPDASHIFRLAEAGDGTMYAGCDGTVFATSWEGAPWRSTGRLSPLAYAVFSFADVSGTLFAGTGTDGAIHALAPDGQGWRPVAAFKGAPNVYDLLPMPGGIAYAAVGGRPGGGAVFAFAPLLSLTASNAAPAPGEPLTVKVAVRPVAARFDAYVVVTGPGGTYSCSPDTPGALVPGVRPFLRGVPGLAVPVSLPVLAFPAIPFGTPPGTWTVIAGLVPPGSPPSERGAIPGYLDSRTIEIRAWD